jgi:hypothetical protein
MSKNAAFETLGIADRGDGHIHLRAGPRKRGQARGHKDRRNILYDRRGRRNLRAHALHDVGQGLGSEDGLLAVSGLGEADDHAVADQGIFPHAFDAGEIADFDGHRFAPSQRSGKRENRNPAALAAFIVLLERLSKTIF